MAARHRILVKALRVAYPHVRVKQTAHVGGIHARGYPPLPEVEVQVLKRDLFRHGFFQRFQRLPCLRQHPVLPVTAYPFLHIGGLLYHVPGYEAVGYLVALCQRVVEHPSFQRFQHVRLRHVADGFHVGQVYSAIQVQRGGQGFLRRFRGDCRFLRKGNGAVEYVRLHHRAALAAFQCQHVAPGGVHHQQFHVLSGIQAAVAHHELVIVGVQVAAEHVVCLLPFRLLCVEPLVGVAHRDVQLRLLLLHTLHVQRLEGRPVAGHVLQHAHLIAHALRVYPCQRAVLQVRLQRSAVRARHHFLLPLALPLFRCHCRFFTAHGFFHLRNPSLPFRLESVFHRIDYRSSRILRFRRFPRIGFFSLRLCCSDRFSGGIGFYLRLSEPAQFRPTLRRERHHRFIESVDGRVRFPVEAAVNGVLRVAVLLWRCRVLCFRCGRFHWGSFHLCCATDDFLHFLCLFRGNGGTCLRLSFVRFHSRTVLRQHEQGCLYRLLRLGLAALLPPRLQPTLRQPPFLLRVAEQVVQIHHRGFRLSALRFLRHAGHSLYFRLHTVFFPFCPVRYTSNRGGVFSFRLRPFTRSRSGVLSFHLCPLTRNRMGIFSFHLPPFTRNRSGVFSFHLNTLGLYGNVLPHILSFMPHAVVAFHVQPCRQVFRQHPVQVHGNTLHTSAVRIYHCRFSVRVGTPLRIGMYDTFRVVGEIGVVRQSAVMFRLYDSQHPLFLCQSLLLQVFLQDDQVAAGFRACIVGKQVVGQSYCRYQIRLAEHLVPDGNPRTVQYPLRGDERHDAAVTHRIQTFQKEIVMDGFLCRTSAE